MNEVVFRTKKQGDGFPETIPEGKKIPLSKKPPRGNRSTIQVKQKNPLTDIYNSIIFVGKEEEAKVLMLSLISKQHALLLGPAGTGKSLLIRTLAKSFNIPYFQYQLTKFTLPEEIFGYPNIKLLREQGVYKYNTANRLPEAVLAFLDEIFKGSSTILNGFLTILNERMFFDGKQWRTCPLWTCLGASNEIPTDPELYPLYDRFQYRIWTKYLKPEQWEQLLVTYWTIHQPDYQRTIRKFNFSIIEDAHKKIWSVDVFTVKNKLLEIFARLKDKGIEIPDRRKGRTLITLASSAVFNNRNYVLPEDLLNLKYTIPEDEEQVNLVEQVIIDTIGKQLKIKQQLQELIPQIRGLIDALKKTQTYEEALKIAEQIKPLHAKFTDLRKMVEGTPEFEQARELLDQFTSILAEKIRI